MARRSELIQAAQGKRECDLVLENARWLDVFTATFREGHLAVYDGALVGVGPEARLPAKRVVDLGGKAVVPGFIDAHVHLESSLMTPTNFQRCVLPKGTTTAVCDPHELANVLGAPGIRYFLEASETLGLSLKVMMSSCVPATTFETNGGGGGGGGAPPPHVWHEARGSGRVAPATQGSGARSPPVMIPSHRIKNPFQHSPPQSHTLSVGIPPGISTA